MTTALFAGPVSAQQQQSADERARLHFEVARTYFEEGNYESALTEFQQAYELSQRSMLLLNIASTQERLGLWGGAADTLQMYLEREPTAADRPILERRIARLRERVSAAQSETTVTPPEPDTESDEPEVGTQPTETESRIESTNEPAPIAPVDDSDDALLPTPALAAYIAGGVGLLAFGVFGTLALAEEGSVSDGCGATRTCGDDDLDPIDTYALIADIGLGVAVVGAVVGTVLLVSGSSSTEERSTASLSVSPWASRSGGGASARLSF